MDLGITYWSEFCRLGQRVADWNLDMRSLESVHPPGLVALYLLTRQRHLQGIYTNIAIPTDPSMQRHLARMDFFSRLDPFVKWEGDVSVLRGGRFAPADRFTPILSLADHTVDEVCDRVWSLFRDHLQRSQRQLLYSPFEEVLANVAEHAELATGEPAFSCLQVQIYWDTIEMSFGDLGTGVRATLAGNPQLGHFPSESDALEAVIQKRRSRFGAAHRYRGGGLRRAMDVVHALGGHSVVQSYDGTAVQNPYDDAPIFRDVSYSFPGTAVWMRLPFQPS